VRIILDLLPIPGGNAGEAYLINDDGWIIGQDGVAGPIDPLDLHGWVRIDGVKHALLDVTAFPGDQPWLHLTPWDINPSGQIVGAGINPNGFPQSFLLTPDISIIGDVNGDGLVDGIDLGLVLANWSIPAGSPGCAGSHPCPADINGDGVVNGLDLGILLSQWTFT
jgi:hypothetical protein